MRGMEAWPIHVAGVQGTVGKEHEGGLKSGDEDGNGNIGFDGNGNGNWRWGMEMEVDLDRARKQAACSVPSVMKGGGDWGGMWADLNPGNREVFRSTQSLHEGGIGN